jgi:peroxiredoxin
MKRFALIVLLALASVRPPSVGEAAPDFRLADQDGKAVSLSGARGGKVVLVFYRGYW